jgi:hypothetical protein
MRFGSAAMLGVVVSLFPMTSGVFAQTVDAPKRLGDVTIVNEKREELTEGSGSTAFGLLLPAGASCPGDSRNDQWRVQTFIVPAEIDPGSLEFNSIGPEGEGLYALYGLDTNPIVEVLTAPNGASGLPGLIIGLRAASFEVFPPGTLPDGNYRVGAACTYFDDTASYWDTELVIERDPEDQPAEIAWRTSDASGVVSSVAADDGGGPSSGLIVVGVLGALLAVVFIARRFRRQPVHSKEMS